MKTYAMTNPFQHGADLKPLQQALKKDHFYNGPIDGIFGASTGEACKTAKWHLGYPVQAVVRTGGQTLMNYLDGAVHLPPEYVVRRKQRGYGITQNQKIRDKIVEYAMWGYHNRAQIHYWQARPMDCLNRVKHLPWYTDCSEFVTTIYKWAGAPDPNGQHYNGYGYTGTMLGAGQTISIYDAQPADVIVWGYFPGHHTAVIVETKGRGSNPMIVSHGSENGPYYFPMSAEAAVQPSYYRIKRYLGVH